MDDIRPSTPTIGSAQFAPAENELNHGEKDHLTKAVHAVVMQRDAWAKATCVHRIELIERTILSLGTAAHSWVDAACNAKGLTLGTPMAGEEWLVGPSIVARNLRLLRDSLRDIHRHDAPQLYRPATTHSNGQVVAPVFPTSLFDRLLFQGFTAEVWMQPDVSLSQLIDTMATAYRSVGERGNVCLVLGAGNVSSIGPTDALYKLFVENQVVVLKMNPVNDYLAEFYERAFRPLIDQGVLRIVNGGAEAGRFLCNHPLVDSIHITGSDKTHDAIVYGMDPEGAERKANRDPQNTRRITSELGNVSPVIIVPGRWTKSDLAFHAMNVATMLSNNAGFNCNAVRVLILHAEWDQRESFLHAVKSAFESIESRKAYYPGAAERYAALTTRSHVTQIGPRTDDALPWAILDVSPDDDHACFSVEAFCSVMATTSLHADTVDRFVDQAVEFANDRVWGTLNASIIVKPSSWKDASVCMAMDRAVANMRFGTVAVNHWGGIGFGLVSPTWGAFPGHPPHDIRSGSGVVHNTYMFDRPQKSIVRGPFRAFPKPVWFANHAATHRLGPALFQFESNPTWLRLPTVAMHALG